MSHVSARYEFRDKAADYAALALELASLLGGERDLAGFYFLKDNELVVGPFQGKPACVRIALGAGVCGVAAAQQATLVVADVQAFPGHIACDVSSRSEIVVPLTISQRLLGVLDLDSPRVDRFDDADRRGIEKLAAVFTNTVARA
jgi:GAF domain-containing protein